MGKSSVKFKSTEVPAGQTCSELVEVLRQHGARSATILYDAGQEPLGIAFTVAVPGMPEQVPIHMTVQTDEIERRLEGSRYAGRQQARAVAWRQLKMLVELQLEIVKNGIKEFHEVFAGDVLTGDGRTVGKRMAEIMAPVDGSGVRLLPPPERG